MGIFEKLELIHAFFNPVKQKYQKTILFVRFRGMKTAR